MMTENISTGQLRKPIIWTGECKGQPCGLTAHSVLEGGQVQVNSKGFYISDQHKEFYPLLESIVNPWIRPLMAAREITFQQESKLHQFIIIFRKDRSYEFNMEYDTCFTITTTRNLEAGEKVRTEDIADILRVSYPNVRITEDDCIVNFFSHSWRHALYFNFQAGQTGRKLDKDEFEIETARNLLALWFPRQYLRDTITKRMQKDGWFPFVALSGDLWSRLYISYRDEPDFPAKERQILEHFSKDYFVKRVQGWWTKRHIENHKIFLERALEHYFNKDYISCISTLYPRIEGILRHLYLPKSDRPNVPDLLKCLGLLASQKVSDFSLLRRREFISYLHASFFNGFDLASGSLDLSRHSATHGVAPESNFTAARALIGFLIIDQIMFYL